MLKIRRKVSGLNTVFSFSLQTADRSCSNLLIRVEESSAENAASAFSRERLYHCQPNIILENLVANTPIVTPAEDLHDTLCQHPGGIQVCAFERRYLTHYSMQYRGRRRKELFGIAALLFLVEYRDKLRRKFC